MFGLRSFASSFVLISSLLASASAHLPYLDPTNAHNSFATAFEFPDNEYSRALCTTTSCPPPHFQGNRTVQSHRSRWSKQSWSKVYVGAGEKLHFEFGVPHLPALEYPSFRPTVYLVGQCLPSCEVFGYPEPQPLESAPFDMPYHLKALRFYLPDPVWEPTKFYESHLDATFLNYLDYTVDMECEGDVYIVVEWHEKRVVEYYVAVGETDEFPANGNGAGIASLAAAKKWAQGHNPNVGKFCRKRGIWERE
ncbi:hypothetical protein DRE_07471 [Drechslerella stenobrocha 248]|uniref:Uncharacterized protein n=1 Tax=Drechslerella stenobrocha 248 TaxID=1043628 RepID=W7HL16_9PEZI|nr:hypothetical protein DRE_07471 [Drechslerella stenobrocha 248]